ncbi:MAG TPA: S9 family peptidase [Thermoanaerobaculia bacterium]|nr:S9 family peptidase [Thermoanaerobaculia bacterium]
MNVRLRASITLVLVLLVAVAAEAAGKRLITEKDLFSFTWIADPEVSPDGSRVAFVRVTVDSKKDRYETSIWSVSSRAGDTPQRITNGPADTAPRWSPDGRRLAFLRSAEKDGAQQAQIYLLSLAGGEPRALTSLPRAASAPAWSPDGKSIAFGCDATDEDLAKKDKKKGESDEHQSDVRIINQAAYRSNGAGYRDPKRHHHIWTVAVADDADEAPTPKQITTGDFEEDDFIWSPDGARIFFVSLRMHETYYEPRRTDLYAIPAGGGEIAQITTIGGTIGSIAVSPDGRSVAFIGSPSTPVQSYTQPHLYVTASAPGSTAKNLTATYDYDVGGGLTGDQHAPRGGGRAPLLWSPDGTSIVFASAEKGTVNFHRAEVASGKISPWTSGSHDLAGWASNPSRSATVAIVSTPTIIGDLCRIEDSGAIHRLTDVNAKLFEQLDLTEPEEIWYTTSDGRKIEAWIQKPPHFDPSKKYPLILNIHGGPHAAYGYAFDHEFQWMAAKGYVVLYPNPRGSTSYGQEFGNVIQYHYPGNDYNDLMAGVDDLIRRGYVDPKKLGVTGGSGGGILTNWIVSQTDRFAAAVAQRSIASWSDFWYTADFTLFQPTWFHKAPWEDRADFDARSPITFIDRVKTPLMLIEGEADYRTPPMSGGEQMFRALKYRHVPTVMIRFPDESHELSRSGKPWHRVERLEHIVNWFDKYLQGAKMEMYEVGLR